MSNQFSDAIQYLANRKPTRKERIGNIVGSIIFCVVALIFLIVFAAGIIHIVHIIGNLHK